MKEIIIDSHDIKNYHINYDEVVYSYSPKISQSFTAKSAYLTKAIFYLKKYGNPTGYIKAYLYAHSGSFGTSSTPTGEPIEISEAIDIASLSHSSRLIVFNFSGTTELIEGTKYCIVLEFEGGDPINNYLIVGCAGTGEHEGNYASYSTQTGWAYTHPSTPIDLIFYIYGYEITPYKEPSHIVKSIATPLSLKVTKEINGSWYANMRILPDDYIETESYIDIKDNEFEEYIVKNVKKIKSDGKIYFDVFLLHNAIEELSAATFDRVSVLKSPQQLLSLILEGCEWKAGSCDIDEIISFKTDRRISKLEALTLLAEKCKGELFYHSKDRIVDLVRQIGTNTELLIRYDKNCTYIEKEEDSSGIITRLYPYGSDNFTINTTILDDCEDETKYIPSATGKTESSNEKQFGSQGIKITSTTLNETFLHTLESSIDLSNHNLAEFWIYSETDNPSGFEFGIGESNYFENKINTGALSAMCWHKVELDLSQVPNANKNAIKYIGLKNLSASATVVFDRVQAYNGNIYIDSPNIGLYRVAKESSFYHSAKYEKVKFEKIIYPSDDSYTYLINPNSNYGFSGAMGSMTGADAHTSFIKFSLDEIPLGATIDKAILSLNLFYMHANNITLNLYLAASNWNEGTITDSNKPSLGSLITTSNMGSSLGYKEITITDTLKNWYNTTVNNYGLVLTSDNYLWFRTKDNAVDKPFIKVSYTLPVGPEPVIKASAFDFLKANDEPKIRYSVKMIDLSNVAETTWEDETINLGDSAKVQDRELKLNVTVRIKKITKNLLDKSDIDIELVNRAFTFVNSMAKITKQLSYAMPFKDNENIISANAIQVGYFGGDTNV